TAVPNLMPAGSTVIWDCLAHWAAALGFIEAGAACFATMLEAAPANTHRLPTIRRVPAPKLKFVMVRRATAFAMAPNCSSIVLPRPETQPCSTARVHGRVSPRNAPFSGASPSLCRKFLADVIARPQEIVRRAA